MRPTRERVHKREDIYFVSTQTAGRKPFFRHERWAQLMLATLRQYAETSLDLHAYVAMPDHLHLLLTPFESVEKAIQLVKGGFSFRARRELGWRGEIWQPGFTDHRIRCREDWDRHLEYIRMNPVKARLAERPEAYEFMGILNAEFPQGLKPQSISDANVRAEARTLHNSSAEFPQGLKPHSISDANVRAEARTLRAEAQTSSDDSNVRAEARTLRNPLAGARNLRVEAQALRTHAAPKE